LKIERISYGQWPEAYRCTAGLVELIIVTSIGPRIMSLRLAGRENLLYEDITDFRVGDWCLYGGHRFTTGPESAASYLPDNEPCQSTAAKELLLIRQHRSGGLRRCMEIDFDTERSAFVIRHRLENAGATRWQGAPWSITCVLPAGNVIIPTQDQDWRVWAPPGKNYAPACSPQWRRGQNYLAVDPNGTVGKIGLCSQEGWIAWRGSGTAFVISGPSFDAKAKYPDGGCNVELYTCQHYLELETLGPLTTLEPGQSLSHEELWRIGPLQCMLAQWPLLSALVEAKAPDWPPEISHD
jgi:hypothetical protein